MEMEKNKIICTSCEEYRDYKVSVKLASLKVRGDIIEYKDEVAICNVCNSINDLNNDSDVLKDIVYPIYRDKHKFVSPEGMIEFRKSLGLTQKEMSILLGWGHVTLTRYENGALQDDAHDSAFQMAMNQHGFRVLINKHGNEIPLIKLKRLQEWATQDIVAAIRDVFANLKAEIMPEIKKQLEAHTYQIYFQKMVDKAEKHTFIEKPLLVAAATKRYQINRSIISLRKQHD